MVIRAVAIGVAVNLDPMPQNSTEGHLPLKADVLNSVRGMIFLDTRHTIQSRWSDVLEPPHDAWHRKVWFLTFPKIIAQGFFGFRTQWRSFPFTLTITSVEP